MASRRTVRELPPFEAAELVERLPVLCTIDQVAAHCQVSKRCVQRWVEGGLIRAARTSRRGPGKTLIPRGEVARMLFDMLVDIPLADPSSRRPSRPATLRWYEHCCQALPVALNRKTAKDSVGSSATFSTMSPLLARRDPEART